MSSADFLRIPACGRRELFGILESCEETWSWPLQWLIQIVHLIKKPNLADRAIHALAMAVCIWATLRGGASDEWCSHRAQFLDEAVRGSSALQAVLRRCMRDECWVACGVTATCGLLDVASYYDMMEYPLLLCEARKWSYPAQSLCMSLALYMCGRVLSWQGWISPLELFPGRGAGTGERNGNHMARLGLYSVLEFLHSRVPRVVPAQWVDDLPLRCYRGYRWTADLMVEAVLCVSLGLRCRGMDLAPKSLIMSNSWQVAVRIQARLAELGIMVKAARQGQDLGIDISCGRRRMAHKHRKRAFAASFKHGRLRTLKFLGVTHSSRVKASLWRQSVRAQNSYAEPLVGQSLASLEQQRRALGHSLDKGKRGRCLTSLIACLEGPEKEPLFC